MTQFKTLNWCMTLTFCLYVRVYMGSFVVISYTSQVMLK